MSRRIEAYCEEFVDEGIPTGGIEHALLRDERREPKPKRSFPVTQLKEAIGYKVDTAILSSREHQEALFRGAFFAFVHAGRYIDDRHLVRLVTKVMARDDQKAVDWQSITELDQANTLRIPLSTLGKDVLPRGRKIMRSHDPFLEAFFTDNAYLLRQIACAATASDPDRMRVFFAGRPVTFSRNPDIYPITQLTPLTPERSNLVGLSNFDRSSFKNGDARKMYSEMQRRLGDVKDYRVHDPSFEFAQVYTGGDKLVSFDFVPRRIDGQLDTIKGHKMVKRIETYTSPWGSIYQHERMEDVVFEQPEEEVGIHFPSGDIKVSWLGKRRVVKEDRDGLMKELMKKYHRGDLSRLNGHGK